MTDTPPAFPESTRLRFSCPTDEDVPAFVKGLNDWAVAQWVGSPPYPYGPEDAREWIEMVRAEHQEKDQPLRFALVEKSSGATIGTIGLHPEEASGLFEVGYWLLPESWGKGYASEALGLLLDYADGPLDISQLIGVTDPENLPSQAVLKKFGFTATAPRKLAEKNRRGCLQLDRFQRDRPA
ncbi:GNAT family N-acetyltransferase [Rhodovibrionaceae bacterium A322]